MLGYFFLGAFGPVEQSLLGFQLCSFGDAASLRTFGNAVDRLLLSNMAAYGLSPRLIMCSQIIMAAFVARGGVLVCVCAFV